MPPAGGLRAANHILAGLGLAALMLVAAASAAFAARHDEAAAARRGLRVLGKPPRHDAGPTALSSGGG